MGSVRLLSDHICKLTTARHDNRSSTSTMFLTGAGDYALHEDQFTGSELAS